MKEKIVKYTPVFLGNQKAYNEGKYRVIINQGSSRSSKTYSIMQLLITICLKEKKSVSVVSHSLNHLKKGARRDFLTIMQNLELYNEDNFNMSDNIYSFPDTGSYIEFFSVDEGGRVMGPGRDILFINEGPYITKSTYTQLAIRTTQMIFIDLNPSSEYSWVYDLSEQPGSKLIISNYTNNRSNLTKAQIEEIENLQHADINAWRVYGLGLRGHSTETIFTHWRTCKDLPGIGEVVYGMDLGFNVETAMVKVEFHEGGIFVKQMLYETKMTTSDRIEKLKELDISPDDEIFIDSAEPATIEEIKRAGFNAFPASKHVLEGISKVKSMPLYITEDSVDLIKEIRNYKWKTDNDGKVLDEPVKFQDHLCDSVRYAVYTKSIAPKFVFWTV